jgi:hypothetical protein
VFWVLLIYKLYNAQSHCEINNRYKLIYVLFIKKVITGNNGRKYELAGERVLLGSCVNL